MKLKHLLILVLGFIIFSANAQPLIVNEVSQGTGNKEYVELLVMGTPYCGNNVPTVDLRKIIIDDNNGRFATGSGKGTAPGAMRFKDIPFWQAVPQGTIIVIYKTNNKDSSIPPDDSSLTDGNCRLILPSSSPLLEYNSTAPTSSNPNYNLNSVTWTSGGNGSWTCLAMANDDDSFQTRSSDGTTVYHAVSWGNNSVNPIIYFLGAAGGKVFSFTNAINNDPALQGNWASANVATGQTPGLPNSPQNAAFIASLNPNCGNAPSTNIVINGNVQNTGCGATCTGAITLNVTGGTAPYTYVWNNGATQNNLTSLCAGTYTVEVTDASGCSNTQQFTVQASGGITVQTIPMPETCALSCNGSARVNVTGGTGPYTYLWSTNATTDGITDLCTGNYTVTVRDVNGCQQTENIFIGPGHAPSPATITGPTQLTTTSGTIQYTANNTVVSWEADCNTCIDNTGKFNPAVSGPGTFEICVKTGTATCNITNCITVVVTTPNPGCTPNALTVNVDKCPGETYTHDGQNYTTGGQYVRNYLNIGGCDSIVTINLVYFDVNNQTIYHTLCAGESVEIGGQTYDQTDTIHIQKTSQQGCDFVQTHIITASDCTPIDFSVFIPNTFTPNNDNINDTFVIIINDGILKEGHILNRWGETIHTFSPSDLQWDGETQSNQLSPDGVYTYVLLIEAKGGVTHNFHGFVTLVR